MNDTCAAKGSRNSQGCGSRAKFHNRTIKEATMKRFHYDNHEQLRGHLTNFISDYNFGRRLKALKGLTPYEFICKQWTIELGRFP